MAWLLGTHQSPTSNNLYGQVKEVEAAQKLFPKKEEIVELDETVELPDSTGRRLQYKVVDFGCSAMEGEYVVLLHEQTRMHVTREQFLHVRQGMQKARK